MNNIGDFNIGTFLMVSITIIVAMAFMPILTNFISMGQTAVGANTMAGQVMGLFTICIVVAILYQIFAQAQAPAPPRY